ncbi:CSC1-like protein erd4, variant 2 [Cymbomonas tetramitiformis]|uniref:CSC1-like protein erd4, variant 2 n=1 Tax=Cymbomonas tetramitiformis TaxID=36881 RepID=A0AAE0KU68_9CHLO|nr:CSC1-like protein erd4, variant 2 [Cymbomonas tetramitiformis]
MPPSQIRPRARTARAALCLALSSLLCWNLPSCAATPPPPPHPESPPTSPPALPSPPSPPPLWPPAPPLFAGECDTDNDNAADLEEFLVALAVQMLYAVVFFALFGGVLRPRFPEAYSPRRLMNLEHKPIAMPPGPFAWLVALMSYPDHKVAETAGLDALVWLNIISFGNHLFAIISFWSLVFVMPFNFLGHSLTAEKCSLLDYLTVQNIANGSPLLWAHVAAAWVKTLVCISLLTKYRKRVVELRKEYFAQQSTGVESLTCLVRRIPGLIIGSPPHRLVQEITRFTLPLMPKSWHERFVSILKKTVERLLQGTNFVLEHGIQNITNIILDTQSRVDNISHAFYLKSLVVLKTPRGLQHYTETGFGADPGWDSVFSFRKEDLEVPVGCKPVIRIAVHGSFSGEMGELGICSLPIPSMANDALHDCKQEPQHHWLWLYLKDGAEDELCGQILLKTQLMRPPKKSLQPQKSLKNLELARSASTAPKAWLFVVTVMRARDLKPRSQQALWNDSDMGSPGRVPAPTLDVQGRVLAKFRKLYGANLHQVIPAYDTLYLDPLIDKRNDAQDRLEQLMDVYTSYVHRTEENSNTLMKRIRQILCCGMGVKTCLTCGQIPSRNKFWSSSDDQATYPRPQHRIGYCGCLGSGQKVDSIDFFTGRLNQLQLRIEQLRPLEKQRESPAAFVIFKTRAAASMATQAVVDSEGNWQCIMAPAPADIYWPNLKVAPWERNLRMALVTSLLYTTTVFYAIPVNFLTEWVTTSLEESQERDWLFSKILRGNDHNRGISSWVMLLCLQLVPIWHQCLSRLSGCISHSDIDISTLRMYYTFQMLVSFGGSIFLNTETSDVDDNNFGNTRPDSGLLLYRQMVVILKNPMELIDFLSDSLINKYMFFCLLIVSRTFYELPINLINPPGLMKILIRMKVARNSVQKAKGWKPEPFDISSYLANMLVVFAISITYAGISPIICPLALIYFKMAGVVWRYRVLYMNERCYDSRGKFWQAAETRVLTALMISQLTLLGCLNKKHGVYQAWAVAPLFFITLFHILYQDKCLETDLVPLNAARDIDLAHNTISRWRNRDSIPSKDELEAIYCPPAYANDSAAVTTLSEEADNLSHLSR